VSTYPGSIHSTTDWWSKPGRNRGAPIHQ